MRKGELDEYNTEMFGYIDRGMFKAIKDKEQLTCSFPANYILCHPVLMPLSDSTKVRIISTSSLPNSKSGWSYNEMLPESPNSMVLLMGALVTRRA